MDEKLTAEELADLLGRQVEDVSTREFRDRLRSVIDEAAILRGVKVFRLVSPGRRSALIVSVDDFVELVRAAQEGKHGEP